jgi:hypothetical protein
MHIFIMPPQCLRELTGIQCILLLGNVTQQFETVFGNGGKQVLDTTASPLRVRPWTPGEDVPTLGRADTIRGRVVNRQSLTDQIVHSGGDPAWRQQDTDVLLTIEAAVFGCTE